MKLSYALFAVLVALQLADAWTTYRAMVTGAGRESNKWLERLRVYIVDLPLGGPWLWLAIAKSWVLIVLAAGWYCGVWQIVPGMVALGALTALYGYVVWKNYKLLK